MINNISVDSNVENLFELRIISGLLIGKVYKTQLYKYFN